MHRTQIHMEELLYLHTEKEAFPIITCLKKFSSMFTGACFCHKSLSFSMIIRGI